MTVVIVSDVVVVLPDANETLALTVELCSIIIDSETWRIVVEAKTDADDTNAIYMKTIAIVNGQTRILKSFTEKERG